MNARRIVIVFATISGVLASGCEQDVVGPRFQALVASDAAIRAAQLGLGDALQRLTPSISAQMPAIDLDASLTDVSRAIDQRNATSLASGLIRLDRALDQASAQPATAADADAVRVVTAPARALLDAPNDQSVK